MRGPLALKCCGVDSVVQWWTHFLGRPSGTRTKAERASWQGITPAELLQQPQKTFSNPQQHTMQAQQRGAAPPAGMAARIGIDVALAQVCVFVPLHPAGLSTCYPRAHALLLCQPFVPLLCLLPAAGQPPQPAGLLLHGRMLTAHWSCMHSKQAQDSATPRESFHLRPCNPWNADALVPR